MFRLDIGQSYNYVLKAKCNTKERATRVFDLYKGQLT